MGTDTEREDKAPALFNLGFRMSGMPLGRNRDISMRGQGVSCEEWTLKKKEDWRHRGIFT